MGARIKKAPRLCCVCKTAPLYVDGRCAPCFRAMDKKLYQRLKGMTRAQRKVEFERATAQPEMPKWMWEGDESVLAAMTEAQEREKQSASQEKKQ